MESMIELKKLADKKYHDEGVQIIPDEEYDVLENLVEREKPKRKNAKIAAKPGKVKLPVQMWSLDKKKIYKKPKKVAADEYLIMDKLDGVSCLIIEDKAFTRGNGTHGSEITKMAEKFIPKNLPKNFAVRGELVVKKSVDTLEFSNARTMVASYVNRNENCKFIDFVAYELIELEKDADCDPENQLKILSQYFTDVVHAEKIRDIDDEKLQEILERRIQDSEYGIDGIVVTRNDNVERSAKNLKKNPKYSFAYKKNSIKGIETQIVDVQWNLNRNGVYVPVLEIDPVTIDGSEIRKVTGHNVALMKNKGMGVGATVEIIKSGKVIPHVSKVVKKSLDIKIPSDCDENGKIQNAISDECKNLDGRIIVKKLQFFAKTLKIAGIGPAKAKEISEKISAVEDLVRFGFPDLKKSKSNDKVIADFESKMKTCGASELAVALELLGPGVGLKKAEKIGCENFDDRVKEFIKMWENKWKN